MPDRPDGAQSIRIEVLYFDGCPNHGALVPRLHELIADTSTRAELTLRRVESPEDADLLRFLGSPTVRVDGDDVEKGAAQRTDFGVKCRLYRTPEGLRGMPTDGLLRDALARHRADDETRSL